MTDLEMTQTMAGDQALMEALTTIDKQTTEISSLKRQIIEKNARVEQLERQMEELTTSERTRAGKNDGTDAQVQEVRVE